MLTTVLFDLDGTLLPMDQDHFVGAYIAGMGKKLAPYGYDPQNLIRSVWQATEAMVRNQSELTNEDVFWNAFCRSLDRDARAEENVFLDYYHNEFQAVKAVCGFDPRAAEAVHIIKQMGLDTVLATNPLFPAVATHSRIRWAGLEPKDFRLITTYENSRRCKPNPDYYREILDTLNLSPQECLMVGNDAAEDMVAEKLGLRVFLLTDCLINKTGADLSRYHQGSFPQLLDYIRSEV